MAKYKAFKDFFNPVTKKDVKKGEIFDVDESKGNSFYRVAEKVVEEKKEVKEFKTTKKKDTQKKDDE